MSHKSEEAACVRRQGVQKLLPQISRAFVVPHALGLLTAADEGKLASAAVLVLELIDKRSLSVVHQVLRKRSRSGSTTA